MSYLWLEENPFQKFLLIVLIIGSFTGGYFGAHLSKLKGNILIKKTFITVCILVGITLLIKSIKSFL